MSTTFNKIVFGSVAAFATVATLVPAQQANAAALKGSFDFDANDETETMATLGDESVNFTPDGEAHIELKDQKGNFVGIENALISDIVGIGESGNPLVGEFLSFTDNEGGTANGNEGEAIFSVTKAYDYVFANVFNSTIIGLKVDGFFTSSTGETSKGFMTFSFDYEGTIEDAQFAMANGGLESSFSGLSVATVPEPATMAGLSMVAVGMALAGRRKKA